jgi:type II secretory pathway pseudopilin PulG
MVVLAIIGVIAVVGIPNLIRAKVRAEMLGQVKMMRQALAVARINAIKGGQQVGLQMETVGGNQTLVAWTDADADEIMDNDERLIGRWTFRPAFSVWEDPSNRLYRLNGSRQGMLFMPTGSARVAQGGAVGMGQGAAIIGDISGNQIRLTVLGGTATVIEEMKVPDTEEWDTNSRHWRY